MKHPSALAWLGTIVLVSCSQGTQEDTSSTSTTTQALASLPNSNFEIDDDANLLLDGAAPALDWSEVDEDRQPDAISGSGDDAFGKGTKEDTAVPAPVEGGIPPNKSDLKTFGVYLEQNGNERFLHMFWHRVQDPSGTTNMDFEFNQGAQTSSNGVTPERTAGDLLVQYDLSNGGTYPDLFLSVWLDGSEGATPAECEASNKLPCWSIKENLSEAGAASGSINATAIPASDSDGLGDVSPRTFGEATVDFGALVGDADGDACVTFGSAYLKSRSSDSFTAALKDYIAPLSVNLSNCGSVRVIKTDDAEPPALLSGAAFSLVEDAEPLGVAPGPEDTVEVASCLTAAGECTMTSILQGEYWLIETSPPPNHDLASPPYQHVTVAADATSMLNFVNPRHRGAILITKTRKHAESGSGDHPHAGVEFVVNGVTAATDENGQVCFDGLLFGDYAVHENTPEGYLDQPDKIVTVDTKAVCDVTPYDGETVAFSNMPLSNITVSFSSQVPGGTAAQISCAGLTAKPDDETPNAFDDTSETFVDLVPGTYSCTVVVDP
jgi:hypothetical protein